MSATSTKELQEISMEKLQEISMKEISTENSYKTFYGLQDKDILDIYNKETNTNKESITNKEILDIIKTRKEPMKFKETKTKEFRIRGGFVDIEMNEFVKNIRLNINPDIIFVVDIENNYQRTDRLYYGFRKMLYHIYDENVMCEDQWHNIPTCTNTMYFATKIRILIKKLSYEDETNETEKIYKISYDVYEDQVQEQVQEQEQEREQEREQESTREQIFRKEIITQIQYNGTEPNGSHSCRLNFNHPVMCIIVEYLEELEQSSVTTELIMEIDKKFFLKLEASHTIEKMVLYFLEYPINFSRIDSCIVKSNKLIWAPMVLSYNVSESGYYKDSYKSGLVYSK